MGRKVHPIGMRLGINQPWQGRWFAEGKTYREQLHQDFAIRYVLLGGTSKGGAAVNARAQRVAPGASGDGAQRASRNIPRRH